MFSVAFQEITERKTEHLKQDAEGIKVRGFNPGSPVEVPADLKGKNLPVHLLSNLYCPTDKYTYLYSIGKRPKIMTWLSFQGHAVENVYFHILREFKKQKFEKLAKKGVYDTTIAIGNKEITIVEEDIKKSIAKGKFLINPDREMINTFIDNLKRLVNYESLLASSLVEYRLSQKYEKSISTCIDFAFPFIIRPQFLHGYNLGFSEPVEADFIYNSKILGDIKTGEYRSFFQNTLAAYALAYENQNKTSMNFGTILNPDFSDDEVTINYEKARIVVIDDIMRKAFLVFRNDKLSKLKSGIVPNLAPIEVCRNCRFYNECRGAI